MGSAASPNKLRKLISTLCGFVRRGTICLPATCRPRLRGNKARNFAAIAGLIALRNAMGMPLKTNLTSDQLAKGQVKPEAR